MLIIIRLLLSFSAAIANEIKERKTAIEKEFTERKEEIKRIDGNHYFLFLMALVNNLIKIELISIMKYCKMFYFYPILENLEKEIQRRNASELAIMGNLTGIF